MPDSPPSPPPQPDTPNPNPNPNSPSQIPQPSTPETLTPIDPQQTQDPQPDNPEPEPEPEPEPNNPDSESMEITLSPNNSFKGINPTNPSLRRTTKRKKAKKRTQAAFDRKMHQLSQGFKPIPFIPCKTLDFSPHEELLRKLGLWDFAHIEFDRNINVDLVKNLIVDYNSSKRGSHVDGVKIGVSRADLARALKLPMPKKVDCDVESFPNEFLGFLDEFVSKWMLLHEDPWCTPQEIVNMMKLIKDGSPHKVDWAGMIWGMMEKELSQKTGLKECYYASHLQHLVKVQKEELFREWQISKVGVDTVSVEDDDEEEDDGGDVKMLDVEESGSVGQKIEEEKNVELKLGQDDGVGGGEEVEKGGDLNADENDEKVEDINKDEVEDINKDEVEDVDKEKDENDIGKNEDVEEEKEEHDCEKVEDASEEKYEEQCVGNSESVDEGKKMEGIESTDFVENVHHVEDIGEESKDEEMADYGDYNGEQLGQGQWLFDSNIEGKPFLQRCGMAEVNMSGRFEDVGEDGEDDEGEEDEQVEVEGFKIMPKGSLDGMPSANLMQALETGQLPFSSNELEGHSSLELMTSRADNNMMLGGPSMFNHSVKREIDHDIDDSRQALNDSHKRMRVDGNWDNKAPEFDVCIAQIQQWVEKAKMSHISGTQEAFQQMNNCQSYYNQQLLEKESELEHWRYQYDDLNRRKQSEIDRLNRELYLMNNVIDGYRRALKQTQRTFSEYRKRCQIPDEPIYKDAGPGGVVKSVMELERERIKQEEENKRMRLFMEDMFRSFVDDFEAKCSTKILAKLQYQHGRLINAVKEMELLKDLLIKRKEPAKVQNDQEAPSE